MQSFEFAAFHLLCNVGRAVFGQHDVKCDVTGVRRDGSLILIGPKEANVASSFSKIDWVVVHTRRVGSILVKTFLNQKVVLQLTV